MCSFLYPSSVRKEPLPPSGIYPQHHAQLSSEGAASCTLALAREELVLMQANDRSHQVLQNCDM